MQILRTMICQGEHDPLVRAVTIRVLRLYDVRARDYAQQAAAIQHWIQRNILYVHEPGDQWYTARRVLWLGGGDCDDLAILAASMCGAIRLPSRLAILQRNGRSFHVYSKVGLPPNHPTRWATMECTLRVPFGWDPTKATRAELRRVT